jgi:hypothetical protein
MADEAWNKETNNQDVQHELIDRAKQEPGIAEALAAYEMIQPYLAQQSAAARPQVRFATGGNR